MKNAAAKKAARTRAANKAMMKYITEVTEPGKRRMQAILTLLLRGYAGKIDLRWNPTRNTGMKLRKGAQYGTLVGFVAGGTLLRILIEGYKHPKDFHPSFWEPLIPN